MTTTNGWLAQMQTWHDGGMLGGMHWLWWLFWAITGQPARAPVVR